MRRIRSSFRWWSVLAVAGTGLVCAQDPAGVERAQWEGRHREVQAEALTEEACTARFAGQMREARTAVQGYIRAVAAGYLLWAKEREERLVRVPELPSLKEAEELLGAEAGEVETRLKELDPVLALKAPVEAVRQTQEKLRFEWRSLPEAVGQVEGRLAPLVARGEGLRTLLKAQQSPLNAELQRLLTVYDLWETEVSRRCAATAAPKPSDDPFVTPPARARPARKKN